MEELRHKENLLVTPFAQLLFRIWQNEKSGRLTIKNDNFEKRLCFIKGNIAVERDFFPEEDFLKTLVEKKILDPSCAEDCERFASQNKCTLVKALHELGPLSASRIWKLMEGFIRTDCFSLFDASRAEYFFEPGDIPQAQEILFTIPTPQLILQGVRQMENYDIIKAKIPQGNESVRILSPAYINQMKLEFHEKYVLSLIDSKKSLKNIYDLSILGKKETQKVIFGFHSLGLITISRDKIQEDIRQEKPPVEFDKILNAFNQKFSYVYKYISKELGPVAFNVLEKCLEETKPCLSSPFQDIAFDREGRIEVHSLLKKNITFADKDAKMNLIKDLNEILVAEVLAVKKNLGHEHELLLVKNLEKMGE